MKRFLFLGGLLFVVAFPLYAQNQTSQDSLELHRILHGEGEIKLNPKALRELENHYSSSSPIVVTDKAWMDFDTSLPVIPKMSEEKMIWTLHPYTANTQYNWDPVYKKKIKIDKHTWRGDPFYELKRLSTSPTAIGQQPSDMDLMLIFTREFWDWKGRKRRVRTLDILKSYGDSTTFLLKEPVRLISR